MAKSKLTPKAAWAAYANSCGLNPSWSAISPGRQEGWRRVVVLANRAEKQAAKPDWLEQATDEVNHLTTRIIKLTRFIASEKFFSLDVRQQGFLWKQLAAMQEYKSILDTRTLIEQEIRENE